MKNHFKFILFFVTFALLSSCHVGRFFVYNFANSNDYKKFPSRTIKPSAAPFEFVNAIDTARVSKIVRTNNQYTSISDFENTLEKNKTVAFLVFKADTLLYEWYGNKYTEEDIVTSFSVSKSFISALIGIALDEGHIKSLDEPITNYIKLFKNPGFDKITIQHLLNMETGIDYVENYYNPFGNVATAYYGRNLDRHMSNLKIKGPPGEKFEYVSIGTQLLGTIIENATEKTVSAYLEEKIWSKIGTTHAASWSVDRKKGREKSFCCINAIAIDFAKFGRLYMNDGNWQGEQIIPKSWVQQSIEVSDGNYKKPYQNQWWLFGPSDMKQPNKVIYAAQGHLGQLIAVDPVNKVMVLRFGKGWGNISWTQLLKAISRQL